MNVFFYSQKKRMNKVEKRFKSLEFREANFGMNSKLQTKMNICRHMHTHKKNWDRDISSPPTMHKI